MSIEPYVLISTKETQSQMAHTNARDPLFVPWGEQSSAKWEEQISYGVRKLREVYPDHSVVGFQYIDVIAFCGEAAKPIAPPEMISALTFQPTAREEGRTVGVLVDTVRYGAFSVTWQGNNFILYAVRWPVGFMDMAASFLVYEGPEEHSRALLAIAGSWTNDLHNEIYVFDGGFWAKDKKLWIEIQKGNWNDVILNDEFKEKLQKDVYGFFDSKELYQSLAIPWKRGIILHGTPGNGKTISLKVIMKECDAKGYYPLYVRSFRSYKGEQGAIVDIFEKARAVSPCVMIFEDLDSLINNGNRSFFLNQLDGLDDNDGLLIIATTNHLDQIDPALSSRPSRFDRKFEFVNPTPEERKSYAQYWQKKLKPNKSISFPDELVDEIVSKTDKFSFAFLKEVFVASLVLLTGYEEKDRPPFASVIRDQIEALKRQLGNASARGKPAEKFRQESLHQHSFGLPLPAGPLAAQARVWDIGSGPVPSSDPVSARIYDAVCRQVDQFHRF
ncbi:hypothetical protein NM688_g4183 [Phlebia brevispora]|uniref:Uncharacterized protein n=1 Tax=Phlebia brevispora TaxID=194682 RepID=A0ACC1T3M3_9APHY|nr:hypothetical protein NM688_g4183 [Phlebia brevispora]